MKQFILDMINSTTPTNSKVFAGLVLLLVFMVEVVVSFLQLFRLKSCTALSVFVLQCSGCQ
jgi:hypothetical protein